MKSHIFSHMDIGTFLQSLYLSRKAADKKFSYSIWARELGFSNKTIVRLILFGKRQMTPTSAKKFKNSMFLNDLESEYFDILVEYSRAKNSHNRNALGQKLIEIHRRNFKQKIVPANHGILRSVYGPIIITLLSSSQKALSLDEISQHMNLKNTDQLKQIMDTLKSEDLVIEENQLYQTDCQNLKIGDHFKDPELRQFYEYWIQKSREAIEMPSQIRRFRSLQIALSQDEFDEVVQRFNEFAIQLLSRFESNTITERRLYLMNNALFPV